MELVKNAWIWIRSKMPRRNHLEKVDGFNIIIAAVIAESINLLQHHLLDKADDYIYTDVVTSGPYSLPPEDLRQVHIGGKDVNFVGIPNSIIELMDLDRVEDYMALWFAVLDAIKNGFLAAVELTPSDVLSVSFDDRENYIETRREELELAMSLFTEHFWAIRK